ncbi:MAG TPA: ABC transporter substrate-binding protein [Pseudonocardia sp.]
MSRLVALPALLVVAALALVGCGGGNTITVGSANFAESQLLAALYAEALKAKGIAVDETPPLGSREAYIPALQDGSIDLIPEYTGTLLQYFDKTAPQTAPDQVYAALVKVLPKPLTVLKMSEAQDKDAVVVTKATAQRYRATSIADLAPHCGELVFGGPPEFVQRPDGLPGIQRLYGCTFAPGYKNLDAGGPLTLKALTANQIQAADIFTTDPNIEAENLVALTDPKDNFAAQNVVPLINGAKLTPQVTEILNAVSAKLGTAALIQLNAQFNAPDKPDQSTVAKEWLRGNGLG